MEATKVPVNGRVDKKVVVRIHNGILLGHKKKEIVTICDDIDGPRGYYATENRLRETNTI